MPRRKQTRLRAPARSKAGFRPSFETSLELRPRRMIVALMAGEATDRLMAVEVVLVDGHHHLDHLARGRFLRLVVGREVALHMAELAILTEREREGLHRV